MLEADLSVFGAVPTPESQAYLEAQRAQAAAAFEIMPCCAAAVTVFLDCQTQWRVAPMGGYVGLDHNAVRGTLSDYGFKRKRRGKTMARVRTIELAALDEWSRQRKAAR